jgi:hypothetical protein
MPDSKERSARAWPDLARPAPRFNYAMLGTDAYEEGLEQQHQKRVLAKLKEDEPEHVFVLRPKTP